MREFWGQKEHEKWTSNDIECMLIYLIDFSVIAHHENHHFNSIESKVNSSGHVQNRDWPSEYNAIPYNFQFNRYKSIFTFKCLCELLFPYCSQQPVSSLNVRTTKKLQNIWRFFWVNIEWEREKCVCVSKRYFRLFSALLSIPLTP